jgi:membrane protein
MAKSELTTTEQVTSIWGLGGLSANQLTKKVWRAINDNFLLDRAAGLAFNFITAIFPLLVFLITLLGMFASRGTSLRTSLMEYLAQVLPPDAYQVVTHTLLEISQNAGGGKLTVGIVLTLWFASGGMNSMISALNGAYEVRDSRPFFKVRATAVVLTFAVSILIVSALISVLAGSYAVKVLGAKLGMGTFAMVSWRVVQIVLALAFVALSFSLIYYFGPDLHEQHWYWITPGSILGVLLWVAASFGFRLYLHFFNSYSKSYGSLGAAIILLMWLYITGLAFLIGGEVNAQIEHATAKRGHPEAKAPGEKMAA